MGEWLTLTSDWARPALVACRLCGRPLFRRVWSAETDGVKTEFCDPDCEALLHDYWLPRHLATSPEEG